MQHSSKAHVGCPKNRGTRKQVIQLLSILLALAAVGSARAQVDPLRSPALIEVLTRHGLDAQQRAIVLDAHEKQVERFVQCVRESTAAWQAALAVRPADQAAANALVSRGRAAASQLDAVEGPVLEAVRRVARPEQAAAVDQIVAELEQRRNLAVWKAALGPRAQPRPVDWQRIASRLQLTDAQRSALEERLMSQAGDRAGATRIMRDSALQLPMARFKSRGDAVGIVAPMMPSAAGDPSVQSASDGSPPAQAVDPNFGKDLLAALVSRGQVGMKEVAAARARLAECDAQVIDTLLSQLNGRGKVRLLSSSATRSSLGPLGVGVTVLRQVVESGTDLGAERAARIDAVLDRWAAVWWPIARKEFTSASTAKGGLGALLAQDEAAQGGSQQQAQDATARAAAEIAEIAPDLGPQLLARLRGGAASGLALPSGDGGVVFDATEVQGGGGDGQPVIVAATTVSFAVSGDELALGGADFENVEVMVGDQEDMVIGGEAVAFDGVTGEMGMPGWGDSDMGDGEGEGGALAMLFGVGSTRLQQPIKMEQVEAALAAAGVGADLMPAVEQLLDDAESSVAEQRETVKQASGGGSVAGGLFVMGDDGSLQQESSKRAQERAAAAAVAREAIFAAESGMIESSLMPLTDTKRASAVAWILPWRALAKERATAPSGSMAMFQQLSAGVPDRGDPLVAVMRSQFSAADWCAAGPTIATECATLSALTRAWADADEVERNARPKPMMQLPPARPKPASVPAQAQGGMAQGVTVSSSVSIAPISSGMADFEAASAKAQDAAQAVRTGCAAMVQRVKAVLPSESAQRLQDAWDDQRFPRELADPTSLASRFDAAEALTAGGDQAAAMRALRTAWEQRSRAIRSQIVQACEQRSDDAASIILALRYERDEWNRRMFRSLSALMDLMGPEMASRIPPLS